MANNLLNFVKRLSLGIKIAMAVMAVSIILFFIAVAVFSVVLIIISVLIFLISIVTTIVLFSLQQNSSSVKDEVVVEKVAEKIKSVDSIEITELANEFKVRESEMRHFIFECVKNKLIEDYTLSGNSVQKKDFIQPSAEETEVIKCTGCGATFASGQLIKECPYCGKLTK